MPGKAYSLPAAECKTGSRLRKIPGSICADCYACKGRYVFPSTQNALYRRFATLDSPNWVKNMAIAINGSEYFRWHDSGDIQSLAHLERIADVCKATPATRHWLPTREKAFVNAYLRKHSAFPPNLTVRVSAAMIDGRPPRALNTSTVHKHASPIGFACPARAQGNKCLDCRACWDATVPNVSYPAH